MTNTKVHVVHFYLFFWCSFFTLFFSFVSFSLSDHGGFSLIYGSSCADFSLAHEHAHAHTPARARLLQAANSSGYGRRRGRKEQLNTVINFVPQQEAWVVERFGKFHDILEPGLRILYPVVDVIKYVHTLKEIVIEIPSQSGITQDNVTMHLDAVIYIKIDNPYKASYGVEDPEYAVAQLAQTTMRSELGQLKLDEVFKERATLNWNIVEAINEAAIPWGLKCLRCEIKDIALPDTVVEDMQRQVSAERRKRASVLESEGKREAVSENHDLLTTLSRPSIQPAFP